ncbi:MAG: CoA transferase [Lentisphaerota bacterium]
MAEQQSVALLFEGYRVLDLSDEKGVLCGKLFADCGADVIKLEPPGGDPMRSRGPFYKDIPDANKSLYWFTFNTNKRGITIDITKKDGQELFRRLVKTAHFIIECFPPGYMNSLGLGYAELEKINPAVIMTSITHFGQDGPYAHMKGSDLVDTGMGGLQFLMGDRERPPVQGTTELGYAEANVQAFTGTMIAHHWRRRTGEGQHVDVSAQECIANTLDTAQQSWDLQQYIYSRGGSSRWLDKSLMECVFPCKDGYMATWLPEYIPAMLEWLEEGGAIEPEEKAQLLKRWENAVAAGKSPAMFMTQDLTQEEVNEYRGKRIALFANRTKSEIYDGAKQRHFGWGIVQSPKDLLQNPQLAGAREYFVKLEHPELGDTLTYAGAPLKLSETPFRLRRRAPLLGEHNLDVYRDELGLSLEELAFLKSTRVI